MQPIQKPIFETFWVYIKKVIIMIQARLDSVDLSLFSPIKENSTPSKSEITCKKVMGAFLIVFGILSVCAFTSCVAAAVILGSAPLAIGAAAVGVLGIGVLISSSIAYRTEPEEYLYQENLASIQNSLAISDTRGEGIQPYVGIVHVNKNQQQRPSVPQRSLLKRPSSGRLQVNNPRAGSTSTMHGHVIPASRDTRDARQGHVSVGTR
jgi:hypothetical protein